MKKLAVVTVLSLLFLASQSYAVVWYRAVTVSEDGNDPVTGSWTSWDFPGSDGDVTMFDDYDGEMDAHHNYGYYSSSTIGRTYTVNAWKEGYINLDGPQTLPVLTGDSEFHMAPVQ